MRNYRHGQDEIDLIAFDDENQEIVFCEVKTRSNDDLADPEIALTTRKIKAQIAAAKKYLKEHPNNYNYRFDLITVLPDAINHYENVTWP
jgi:putative endonuclease